MTSLSAQRSVNDRLWTRTDLVRHYRGSDLRPVEAVLLEHHRRALSGRVLEMGCGAGRLTGHLAEIATELTAMDFNPRMVEATAARFPDVRAEVGDIRDLSGYADGSFDAVVAGYNLPDVLDNTERGAFLDDVREMLSPGGLLIMSTHNLAAEHRITEPLHPGLAPKQLAALALYGHRWRRNRRRLLPHERREDDHAILNDVAHDFAALHYYIGRDAEERQLRGHGYELLECLDLEGGLVAPGELAADTTELHYVARTPSSPAA